MSDWKWCMTCDHHVDKHRSRDEAFAFGRCTADGCTCAHFDWNGELP